MFNRKRNRFAESALIAFNDIFEVRIKKQVVKPRIAVIRFFDFLQERRADDASSAKIIAISPYFKSQPYSSDAASFERSPVRKNRFAHEECFSDRFDQLFFVLGGRFRFRTCQKLACFDALFFHGRNEAGENGFRNDRKRHAQVKSALARPFSCAFLTCFIEDDVNERLASFLVFFVKISAVISIR